MNNTAHRDGPRCIWAAQVALGWVVVFLGFHIYWYLGGSFGSPGRLPGWPHSLSGWTFTVLVDGAFALGLLVPWVICRGRALGRLAQPVGALACLGGMLLVLRGGTGLLDDLTRITGILPNGISGLSTEQTTGTTDTYVLWSGVAIDAYFLAGGMIFSWLAISHRQRRLVGVVAMPSPEWPCAGSVRNREGRGAEQAGGRQPPPYATVTFDTPTSYLLASSTLSEPRATRVIRRKSR
jgi:hypothetical protein